MKKLSMKMLVAIGGIIFLSGAIICVIALSVAEWNFKNLSTRAPLEEMSDSYVNTNQNITLIDADTRVIINKSSDEKIHISYQESEDLYYIIDTASGIKFEKKDTFKWYQYVFTMNFDCPTFTISLPDGYEGTIDLKSTNGKITGENFTANKVTLKTTNDRVELKNITAASDLTITTTNGRIKLENIDAQKIGINTTNDPVELKNVEASGDLILRTTNGRVELESVIAQKIDVQTSNDTIKTVNTESLGSVSLKTTNGNILIANLKAGNDIDLKTTNSKIEGTINGKKSDYKITSRITNANNNLSNTTTGSLNLTVTTSNGKINIDFIG